jgi:kynurenine formamidase
LYGAFSAAGAACLSADQAPQAELRGGGVKVLNVFAGPLDTESFQSVPHRNCIPPEFGQCGPFRMEEVSRYDERGPAWYWNNSSMGEHTGTHFDAPIYWVTSKKLSSNAVDTIPPGHFLAPARVIDCSAESAADVDFLLTIGFVEAWEARHGQIPPRSWVLLRTDWRKRPPRTYVNLSNDGPHSPGPAPAVVKWLGGARLSWFWKRNYPDRCRAGSAFQPAVPAHHYTHGL